MRQHIKQYEVLLLTNSWAPAEGYSYAAVRTK